MNVIVLSRSVAPLHGIGGLERHVQDLVRHLGRRGIGVTLITRPPAVASFHDSELPGTQTFVPYPTFPFAGRRGTTVLDRSTAYPLFGLRAGRLAAQLVRRGGVQIVHGMGAASLGYARARKADRFETVPFVFNPHGMEEFGSTGPGLGPLKHVAYAPLRRAVRACAGAADRVIATDHVLVPTVQKHLGVPEDAISVLPNAVDVEEIDRAKSTAAADDVRARLGLARDDVLLVGVGRLEENKGYQHLIAALSQLAKRPAGRGPLGRRWACILLGEGSFRPRLERSIADAELGAAVLLPGRLHAAELHAFYDAATLFVHPTLYEGSSIVTLEAMAHGLAIVATRAGGLPDKVSPGKNGWLLPPGDPGALADAIEHALADRVRLKTMGHNSRAIVEQEFAWGPIADRTIALYEELLRTSAAAR